MANFDKSGMTQAGINLMGKAIGGATIQFTKLVLGDGTMTGEILDLQGVVSPKQNVDVTRIERNDNQCTVGGELLTSSVKQGFFWRECGLYAMDPDVGEILYNYAYSTKPDYIAAADSGMMEEIMVAMIATVGSNTNVDVSIDSSMVFTSKKEFTQKVGYLNEVSVNVKEFGAIGDGVHDDTDAIQRALDSKCGFVDFPEGTYLISKIITVPQGVTLRGHAKKSKVIVSGLTNYFSLLGYNTITGITFDGNGTSRTIISTNKNHITLDDCIFRNCYSERTMMVYYHSSGDSKAEFLTVTRCIFEDFGTNRLEGSEQGVSRAIYTNEGCTNINIKGCTFRGIYPSIDADYIHINGKADATQLDFPYVGSGNTLGKFEDVNVSITDNIFFNPAKSTVKLFGSNANISNNTIYIDKDFPVDAISNVYLLCRVYHSQNIQISNNKTFCNAGKFSSIIEIKHCKDVVCDNNTITVNNEVSGVYRGITFHGACNVLIDKLIFKAPRVIFNTGGSSGLIYLKGKDITISNCEFICDQSAFFINFEHVPFGNVKVINTSFIANKAQVPINSQHALTDENKSNYLLLKDSVIKFNEKCTTDFGVVQFGCMNLEVINTHIETPVSCEFNRIQTLYIDGCNLNRIVLRDTTDVLIKNTLFKNGYGLVEFIQAGKVRINKCHGVVPNTGGNAFFYHSTVSPTRDDIIIENCSIELSDMSTSTKSRFFRQPSDPTESNSKVKFGKQDVLINGINCGTLQDRLENVIDGATYYELDSLKTSYRINGVWK